MKGYCLINHYKVNAFISEFSCQNFRALYRTLLFLGMISKQDYEGALKVKPKTTKTNDVGNYPPQSRFMLATKDE